MVHQGMTAIFVLSFFLSYGQTSACERMQGSKLGQVLLTLTTNQFRFNLYIKECEYKLNSKHMHMLNVLAFPVV